MKKNGVPAQASVEEFDQEMIVDSFHPLSKQDQAEWNMAQQKKPRRCNTSITVQVRASLLAKVDGLAEKPGVSRDSLITQGIQAVLARSREKE